MFIAIDDMKDWTTLFDPANPIKTPNLERLAKRGTFFTHWIFAALLTLLFPIAIRNFDAGYIFAFFCLMMVLQLIWVKTMVPETKGRSLEEIEKNIGFK